MILVCAYIMASGGAVTARRICHVVRWSRFRCGQIVTAELHLQHLKRGLRTMTGIHNSNASIEGLRAQALCKGFRGKFSSIDYAMA